MTASFDIAASAYDDGFTNAAIGSLQRRSVYKHLSKVLQDHPPKTILEINCGTGADAIWLAGQNFSVTATDISAKMIGVAKSKIQLPNLHFHVADINKLPEQFDGYQFDMIFSNFGGLNCLSPNELQDFFQSASGLLSPRGRLVLVIMPKDTLWEKIYFLAKGKFRHISRRKKKNLTANVDGVNVPVHYYNPNVAKKLAFNYFDEKQLRPIGFFVPPSYLEPYFRARPFWLSMLRKLDDTITQVASLARFADHYFIVFAKK